MPNRNLHLNIGFLLSDVSRMLRRIFNERVTPLGLTQAQWRALVQLSRNQGLNQVGLSELLEVQPITVARLIDKLVASGLVERRPDPSDRRSQRLFLTDQAMPLLEQIWEIADETYDVVLAGLTQDQRTALIAMLTSIRGDVASLMSGGPETRTANGFRQKRDTLRAKQEET